jgi:hypothetical protein
MLGFAISAISICFLKSISTVDVFLPIPISVIWCVILFPLKVSTDLISPATMIASAFLLTWSLWLYKEKKVEKGWIIVPILMFLYEMLPVNIPLPFDDVLAVGASGGNMALKLLYFKSTGISLIEKDSSPLLPGPDLTGTHIIENISIKNADPMTESDNAGDAFQTIENSEVSSDFNGTESVWGEVKSLGDDFAKMVSGKPKIKHAIVENAKKVGKVLKGRIS